MIKNKIFLLTVLITLYGCAGVKETLSLQKKQGVDEFLIEKKNPLVLPPDFSKLPEPRDKSAKDINEGESIDLSKVLDQSKNSNEIKGSNNLEKSISDLLKKK